MREVAHIVNMQNSVGFSGVRRVCDLLGGTGSWHLKHNCILKAIATITESVIPMQNAVDIKTEAYILSRCYMKNC